MRILQGCVTGTLMICAAALLAQTSGSVRRDDAGASTIQSVKGSAIAAQQESDSGCRDADRCEAPVSDASDTTELYDYLVQDVCLDGAGQVIAGDPATCHNRRNIAIGEASPYIMTDFERRSDNRVSTYESISSIPVHGTDGTTKILITKSLEGDFRPEYGFNWNQARDAYDLIDQDHSAYASYVRTSDPGCQDQIWSRTGSAASMAQRAGGWILFPTGSPPSSWPLSSSTNVTTYHIQVTPNRGSCGNNQSTGVTYWNKPASYHFEADRTLTAIRSFHFANKALYQRNNAMEKYYFTREYGATRWESWVPQSRCFAEKGSDAPICHPESANYPLKGRCSVLNANSTPYAGLDIFGNQYWVMIDCRDHSNFIGLNTPQLMVDDVIAQNDGYKDIDR